jgi:hypothetical protein
MRSVRIILIFLCLFILKGYNHAFARIHKHPFRGFPVQIIENKNSIAFSGNQDQDVPVALSLYAEGDDNDSAPARKKAMISRFSAINTISFLSNLSCISNNNRQPPEHLCYFSHERYIFQRTLRV